MKNRYPIILGGNVVSSGIKADLLGNTYVIGTFSGTADFDPGADTANLTNAGGSDIFIARYDALGRYIYAKSIGSTGGDAGNGIAVDASGNVYITGSFSGTVDFDPGADSSILTSAAGTGDIFIARYDATGKLMFAKALNRTQSSTVANYGNAITLDNSGNAYVTGSFSGTVDFDPGPGTALITSEDGNNAFVAGYDASGNYLYAKGIGGQSYPFYPGGYGTGIAVDSSGNVYVTGSYQHSYRFKGLFIIRYDPSGSIIYAESIIGYIFAESEGIAVDGSGNAYIIGFLNGTSTSYITKYDPAGNQLFTNSLEMFIRSIAVDGSGNVYISGSFIGNVDFDPGSDTAYLSTGSGTIFMAKYDPSGNYVYAKAMGATRTTSVSGGNGIDVATSGRIYITGTFQGIGDFDPGADTTLLTIGGTGINTFVSCFDPSGNYAWAVQLGFYSNTPLNDRGESIAVDGSGNVYVAGSFQGTVDFDPGAGAAYLTSAGVDDIFIAKYDPSGNYMYAIALVGTMYAEGISLGIHIAVDGPGNVYVTGSFQGTVDFDPGAGTAYLTPAGVNAIFFAKYDPAGRYVYAKAMGGRFSQAGSGIAVDGSGNIYITGLFMDTVDFDPGTDTANLTTILRNIFFAKYDASGNYVYAKAMEGTGDGESSDIAVDRSANVYLTGSFKHTIDFDPGGRIASLTSNGNDDIFIAKYDAPGNYVYAIAMGGANADKGRSMAVDSFGNVCVTGSFSGTADFDPGSLVASLTSAGLDDIFMAKYDPSGNYVYAKAIGGPSNEFVNDIAVEGSGNAYLTGSFVGTVDFDPGADTASLTSLGIYDIFIAKYNAAGDYVYAKAMGGTNSDEGSSIAVDAPGNIYITGFFNSTADFDRDGSAAIAILSSINGTDIFIAKYGPLAALPVQLLRFQATPLRNGKAVQVNWTTASQTNHGWFDVERSKNSTIFETIGHKQGCSSCTGMQQYELFDNNPYSGLSYYRLKQVDLNYRTTYSAIVPVYVGYAKNITIQVIPTITDGACTLKIDNGQSAKQVIIRLFGAAGHLLKEQSVWLAEGSNTLPYSLYNQSGGVYYICVADKTGTATVSVMVVKK